MEVNIYAAKTQLSSLVRRAAGGEEIVITRNGEPVARLTPIGQPGKKRKLGRLRDKIRMPGEPPPQSTDDLLATFAGGT
jgi:prevent-host-death family protein